MKLDKKYLETLDLSDKIIKEYPNSILINNILGVIHTELKNYTFAKVSAKFCFFYD